MIKKHLPLKHLVLLFDYSLPFYLLATLLLFIISLFVPVMDVQSLWIFNDRVSILSALKLLWISKAYIIFALVVIFSIIFPLLKLILLSMLSFSIRAAHHRVIQPWQQQLLQ